MRKAQLAAVPVEIPRSLFLKCGRKKMNVILKTKDLAQGDPANKGLTGIDLVNKGLRRNSPFLRVRKTVAIGHSSLIPLAFHKSVDFYFIDFKGFSRK